MQRSMKDAGRPSVQLQRYGYYRNWEPGVREPASSVPGQYPFARSGNIPSPLLSQTGLLRRQKGPAAMRWRHSELEPAGSVVLSVRNEGKPPNTRANSPLTGAPDRASTPVHQAGQLTLLIPNIGPADQCLAVAPPKAEMEQGPATAGYHSPFLHLPTPQVPIAVGDGTRYVDAGRTTLRCHCASPVARQESSIRGGKIRHTPPSENEDILSQGICI